jgi:hypothetical protein
MPNWCDCDLYIKGSLTERDSFVEYATSIETFLDSKGNEVKRTNYLDFNKFIPYPKHFKDADEIARKARIDDPQNGWQIPDGYNSGGYDWCIKNWGVKWPPSDINLVSNKHRLRYSFQTPWAPPGPAIMAMSKEFNNLTFTLKWFEGGMGYQGVFVIKGGEVLENTTKDYHGRRGG